MGDRSAKFVASALAVALGLSGLRVIGFPERAMTQSVEERKKEADWLLKQGIKQYRISQHEVALQFWQKALQVYREIKDRRGEVVALGNLGTAYKTLNNYAKAIEYQKQSLEIAHELKDQLLEGQLLGNLGNAYLSLGDYAKAIDFYERSLDIAYKLKDRLLEGNALGNLGNAYLSLSDYAKAINYYEQSLEIKRELKDRLGEEQSLGNLGSAYYSLGNYTRAIDYQKQTLAIARELRYQLGEGQALGNLGNAYNALGNYTKAIDYHHQSLVIARAMSDRTGEGDSLSNIGLVFAKNKQFELAIAFYKHSVNVYETIRQSIKRLPREAQETYTSSIAITYRDLATLLLAKGRFREAQAILELLKVQEVRDYGLSQEANSPPFQLPLYPLEYQAIQTFEKTITSQNSLSLRNLTTLGQPLIQNRDRIAQESNNTPIKLGNPQAIFNANPDALLIQNLVVGNKFWVIWTDASGNTTASVELNFNLKQFNTTVQSFRTQIGSPYSNLNTLKTTSIRLYNWLIPPPLQAELAKNPKKQLIFSLDHVTRYIPVAALYDGNQYLAQRYILSNLVTMDSDMSDRLSLSGRSPTVLALGTTKAFPGFSALPNVASELNAIVRDGNDKGIYPGKIRLNGAFTANSLRENLDQFRILHIATHGSFNSKSITASYILLGDGTHLPITDIASLTNLDSIHLVVLSACETGLSSSGQDGTEISGISGYFLYRGAKAILASLWQVNDASTSVLMQRFYQNWATGKMSKAEALRQAQRSMIQGNGSASEGDRGNFKIETTSEDKTSITTRNLSHPYYWAPFILIGNNL